MLWTPRHLPVMTDVVRLSVVMTESLDKTLEFRLCTVYILSTNKAM